MLLDEVTSFADLQHHLRGPMPARGNRSPTRCRGPCLIRVELTGWPKGVMLTALQPVAMLCQLETASVLHNGDRVVLCCPLLLTSMDFTWWSIWGCVPGATVVTPDRDSSWRNSFRRTPCRMKSISRRWCQPNRFSAGAYIRLALTYLIWQSSRR